MSFTALKTRVGNIVAARPNWTEPVIETREYLTAITESFNGEEQRDALRIDPRVSASFRYDHKDRQARRVTLEAYEDAQTGATRHLPLYWRFQTLDTAISTDDTTITLPASPAPWWIAAGQVLAIEDANNNQELVTVTDVTGDTITVSTGITQDFAAGATLCPAIECYPPQVTSGEFLTDTMLGGAITFEQKPGTGARVYAQPIDHGSHEGFPILLTKPDWSFPLSFELDNMQRRFDAQRSNFHIDFPRDFIDRRQTFVYRALTRAKAEHLIGFFDSRYGRQKPFWLSTHQTDMVVPAGGSYTGSSFNVVGTEINDLLDGDIFLSTICCSFADGSYQFNRIDSVGVSGGNTVIVFRDAWENTVDETTKISWGLFCRFLNDRLTVNWGTDEVAEISLSVKVLRNDWIDTYDETRYKPIVWNGGGSIDGAFDPGTYSEWDIEYEGVSKSLVDFLDVTFEGNWTGTFNGNGTTDVQMQWRVFFLDENGGFLTSPDGAGAESVFANWDWPDGEFYTDSIVFPPVRLPAGTRKVRVRFDASRGWDSYVSDAWLNAKRWGLHYDNTRLQWL